MKFISAIVAAIAVGCLSTAALSQSTAVQWTTESGGNGHWYLLQTAATGYLAETAAASSGGHLATISTVAENQFIQSALVASNFQFGIIGFVQASDQPNPDVGWHWVTGEGITFTNWTDFDGAYSFVAPDDNPCNCCGVVENNQCNQSIMYVDGRWDDIERGQSCAGFASSQAAVIEWSADCNSDGIVDYGQILSGQLIDANSNKVPDSCETPRGYAKFSRPTDTIRVLGNTVFLGVDFTYEMRIRVSPSQLGVLNVITEQRDSYEHKMIAMSPSNFFGYMVRGLGCGSENAVGLAAPFAGEWRHLAWVRTGTVARLYIDGVVASTFESQANCTSNYPNSIMCIGKMFYGTGATSSSFSGDIDWIRVSSGSVYTQSFSAPDESQIFANNATQLLLKFNDSIGASSVIDDSPNHFTCNLGTDGTFPTLTQFENDTDSDGIPDSTDACPTVAGSPTCNGCPLNVCGECGIALDTDSDGTANCIDDDDDNDGVADSADAFPLDANESVDTDGDGIGNNADQDDDGDGADDATDGCPLDANKSAPGQCGCGIADTDSDGDGVADCVDNCVAIANPTQADCNGNGIGEACESFTDCNANSIPDSCDISAGNGSPYPGAVQWTVASGGNGHWYAVQVRLPGVSWEEADVLSRGMGGYLATIGTLAEDEFVFAVSDTPGAWPGILGPWLGAKQASGSQEPSEGWHWTTNEPWTYLEPSNWADNGAGGPEENYLHYMFGRSWNDANSSGDYEWARIVAFVVEWPSGLATESDCNFNGIPDSCDIASGAAGDCNTNSIPDSCEVDSDADGTIDTCDGCPNDPAKIAAGACGCGVADTDTDSDGTANCIDDDDDGDGVADSADAFPLDASESVDTDGDGIGNNADQDDDGDGADDATDGCPLDANKSAPGQCGCGNPDTDSDGDSVADCVDNCVAIANLNQNDCNGNGIGEACETFTDCNANSIPDSCDLASGFAQDCNANGIPDSCDIAGGGSPYAGAVQWTVASGGNGHWYWVSTNATTWEPASEFAQSIGGQLATIGNLEENSFVRSIISSNTWLGGFQSPGSCEPDCEWQWVTGEPWSYTNWTGGEPNNGDSEQDAVSMYWYSGEWDDGTNIAYQFAMIVEWSATESDCNSNGVPDSCEIASGAASDCNTNAIPDSCELDSDVDGTIDACDGCPNDPAKIAAGICGCGVADTDTDSDGTANCIDDDDDNDGAVDSADAFPLDASESVDTDGDGIGNNADQDDDGDGADDATDGCPLDPAKSSPGQCGCGNPDTDSDGDGIANCVDNCVAVSNPTQDDCNSNGIGEACESFTDCNANGIPDSCDIASGFAQDCNGNGKPDSCDLAVSGSPYAGAVQWTVASGGNGHWYLGRKISTNTAVSWTDARTAANAVGADLAITPNEATHLWVFANVASNEALWSPSFGPWVGGYQSQFAQEPGGGWMWIDGSTNGVNGYWLPGQPDNATVCGGPENYLHYMRYSGLPANAFNDMGHSGTCGLYGNGDWVHSAIFEWSTGLPTESDCNSNGIPDSCEIASGSAGDCNNDGILNSCEIAAGALDCNSNGIPDTCDVLSGGAAIDCNANGIPDSCDIASGASMDCNSNAIPDSCDIAAGASQDVDSNGVPDECKPDCNNNDLPDAWEIAQGLVPDCNNNGIPDSCENDSRAANTGNMGRFGNGVPATGTLSAVVATTTAVTVRIEAVGDLGAATEYATLKLGQTVVGTLLFQTTGHDCPANPDVATLTLTKAQWNAIVASAGSSGNVTVTLTGSPLVDAAQCGEAGMSYVSVNYGGPAYDCDGNGLSDLCEVGSGTGDCNNNSILDACELLSGSSPDIDANGVIDSCQTDCNGNSLPDTYEVAQGLVPDCNGNGIPDSCDLAGGAPDCNANGIIDSCDIASGSAPDCNGNGKPDSCDISSGFAADCNANSIPDSCDISSGTVPDCNNNGVPDSCDVASGAPDCNNNGVPDSCDVASGSSNDVDTNGVPDECKTDCNANGLPDAWEILQHLVPDCNGNSVPDSCDVADGTAKDCNDNGIPDSCDIAAGEVDKNSDGQPDSCQYLYGDFDLDGNIGGSDLAVLLALWGVVDPVIGDITGDGRVDGQDLAQILARWGPIP